MIGKLVLTAGLALSLLAAGSSAQAAPFHKKHPLNGANATCKPALIAGYYAAIEITVAGVLPVTEATYLTNGKNPWMAAVDGQFYTPAVVDGLNTVTDSVNGVVVASCSLNVSGLIYP